MAKEDFPGWHGTTIIGVRKGGKVVIAGDGQVSLGQTVIKGTARKVRRLSPGGQDVIAGFAGSTASPTARPSACARTMASSTRYLSSDPGREAVRFRCSGTM